MPSQHLSALLRKPGTASSAEGGGHGGRSRRVLWSRLFPLALLLGFAAVALLLFGERLLPARTVNLANVVTLRDDPGAAADVAVAKPARADAYAAPVLFQASGWIEPDPLPSKATALVSGVVEEVFVLEGETVEKGQVLATLIDDDARLDLETARASLEATRARLSANDAAIRITQAGIETLEKRIDAARAVRDERADAAERLAGAGPDSVAEADIVQARLRLSAQEAEVAALQSERAEMDGRLEQLRSTGRELAAQVALGKTEVARRELTLERTRIASPLNGRVLRLLAVPGQQRMLGAENPDSAVIAYLYEPDKLQARIDVPLAEAAQMQPGQAVKVRTNFLPDRVFRGTVTRVTGEADLQRNTLQAKVAIENPDGRLRPEMLCRAEFLAPVGKSETAGAATTAGQARVRLYVPEAALIERSGASGEVWVLDDSGERVRRQSVTLGSERRENFIRVREGLKPGDRVVLDPPADLEPGTRVAASTTANTEA